MNWLSTDDKDSIVQLPPAIIDGQEFKVKIGKQEWTCIWQRKMGILSVLDAKGMQQQYRLRQSQIDKLSSGDFDVSLEFLSPTQNDSVRFKTTMGMATPAREQRKQMAATSGFTLKSPMNGKILNILVSKGQSVTSGNTLLVIEAMKMENSISADSPGTVKEILVAVGDVVKAGQVLVKAKAGK